MSGDVFTLYACCVPVRGARRSTICDLQRNAYRFIPNGLFEILTEYRHRPVAAIKAAYGDVFDTEIDQYFAFLIENEFGFWCDNPDAFPELDTTWEAPETISNAIIDIGRDSAHDFASLAAQLDALGCRALQIRTFCAYPVAALATALDATARSRLRSIDLLVRYSPEYDEGGMRELLNAHPRIMSVVVHSAPRTAVTRPAGPVAVTYVTQSVDSEAHCGQVHPGYFAPTLAGFTEAKAYNSCLNRKLSIDQHGDLRNCPSMPQAFGNASTATLQSAVAHPEFSRMWAITKDQIETCRDCEFRYICTDCRAYVRAEDDPLSKPAKCTYDPYTAQWGVGAAVASPIVQLTRGVPLRCKVANGPEQLTAGAGPPPTAVSGPAERV